MLHNSGGKHWFFQSLRKQLVYTRVFGDVTPKCETDTYRRCVDPLLAVSLLHIYTIATRTINRCGASEGNISKTTDVIRMCPKCSVRSRAACA